MSDLANLPADARLYLEPVRFVASPIGLPDGSARRVGNTLVWFSAYELTARKGAQILARQALPVADFDAVMADLPEPLATRARLLATNISAPRPAWTLGERVIRFDTPQVMGILNVTPDSFSDGGRFLDDPQAASDAGFAMSVAGAAVVDVGGESTRPNAKPVWEGDEIKRVVPAIERLAAAGVPLSVDTRKATVMRAALSAGASIVNDVSALQHDPEAMSAVAEAGCPVVLMHSASRGADPHAGKGDYAHTGQGQTVLDIFDHLEARIAACEAAGIGRDRIMVDPGIGFGKSLADDVAITNHLALYHGLGLPLLYAASRKRMVGALSNEAPSDKRLGGSVALAFRAAELGAAMVRVHDVEESVQALRVWRGLRDGALTEGV